VKDFIFDTDGEKKEVNMRWIIIYVVTNKPL